MPSIAVHDHRKQPVGTIDLHDRVFGVPPNKALVHAAVTMQQASLRQGSASTLGRGEVSGSGKKPWRQKHTGRARAGSKRSPLWRHGGTVFGPKPRRYGYAIPRKMYRAALRSALSQKVAAGEFVVVSELVVEEPKTRALTRVLRELGLNGRTLIIRGSVDDNLDRAARNLPYVKVASAHELNILDILLVDYLLIPQQEIAHVQEAWS